jgi:hypothetical protein
MTPGKKLVSLLIVWHAFTLLVDGSPPSTLLQERLQQALHPYLSAVGQWQGNMAFFAPDPDNLNLHLEATIYFFDGSIEHWRSPDWKKMSPLQKFAKARMMKYVDQVRRDENRAAWEGLAGYLARQYESGGKKVRHVEISRHSAVIPPPLSEIYNAVEEPLHPKNQLFYQKDFS